jgi:hypothetical protein
VISNSLGPAKFVVITYKQNVVIAGVVNVRKIGVGTEILEKYVCHSREFVIQPSLFEMSLFSPSSL